MHNGCPREEVGPPQPLGRWGVDGVLMGERWRTEIRSKPTWKMMRNVLPYMQTQHFGGFYLCMKLITPLMEAWAHCIHICKEPELQAL